MNRILGGFLVVLLLAGALWWLRPPGSPPAEAEGREEVVFWHFWGGADRVVVEDVVRRFNASQSRYFVRAVAMPGNNLQAKLFLAVAGGDPPDLVNQDDPVIPDWAWRGVIQPLDEVAPPEEVTAVTEWMLPSARRLSTFEGRVYGICNGLDIRALYYNRTMLEQHGLEPPEFLEDLDQIAETIAPPGNSLPRQYGYLPDTRRLWAWGYVFGGNFVDAQGRPDVASSAVVAALEWMAGYRRRYGADNMAAFRQGDQSLPGAPFPLLPTDDRSLSGRYAVLMDGQWRVRDLDAFQAARRQAGQPCPEFGVCPLPVPRRAGARPRAGWVNGNFFVIPRGARCSRGAWEFSRFWIGFQQPSEAARTCAAGGWIPVAQPVIDTAEFQKFLAEHPLFAPFVDLAGSENQFPTPPVVGAARLKRAVEEAAYQAVLGESGSPAEILQQANRRLQQAMTRERSP